MARSSPALPAVPDRWWSAFGDATLDALVAAAQWNATDPSRAVPTLETRVAAAWASARADGVVLRLVADAQAATRRQDSLLAAMTPTAVVAQDRAALAQRTVACTTTVRTIAPRRHAAVALLAGLCGTTEDAVERKLAPAFDGRCMPRFSAAGFDDPGGRSGRIGSSGAVREALADISAQCEVEAVLSRCAVAMHARLQDLVAGVRAGTADEFGALEQHQQLVLCSQQIATVGGALALRWIGLFDLLDRQAASSNRAPVHTAAWTSCGR